MIAPARRTHFALPSFTRLTPLLVAALAALGAGACKVDQNKFEARIFQCDTTSPDPLCGTDQNGAPLTCFAARQIGGVDFCAPACGDVPMSLPDAECVQGGALLAHCTPSTDSPATPSCDRSQLGCLRTDVLGDEGICLTMNPCSTNTDCRDPVRSTCGATFLRELYSEVPANDPGFNSDHLYCLQEGCDKNQSSCSPGETCLKKVIPAAAKPIDICVPNCDSQGRCPPNHFCLSTVSGPANPSVCIPGLLGFVCQNDIDCLLGKCTSDGDATSPLKLCTATCKADADCSKFDSVQGHFVCSTDGRCITPDAYTGTLCRTDADCGVRDKGTFCRKSPVDPTAPTTCLRPCDPNDPTKFGLCQPRGGIGHSCLPFLDAANPDPKNPKPSCFPGDFGFPCLDKSQCAVPELQCFGAVVTAMSSTPGFCTVTCTQDSDCTGNRWTGGDGYCATLAPAPAPQVCVPLSADGAKCAAANECQSKTCGLPAQSTADASKVCGGTGS